MLKEGKPETEHRARQWPWPVWRIDVDSFRKLVSAHQKQGVLADDSPTSPLATSDQHLHELRVVRERRDKPAPAAQQFSGLGEAAGCGVVCFEQAGFGVVQKIGS